MGFVRIIDIKNAPYQKVLATDNTEPVTLGYRNVYLRFLHNNIFRKKGSENCR